jgi:hypothetical protein
VVITARCHVDYLLAVKLRTPDSWAMMNGYDGSLPCSSFAADIDPLSLERQV